MVKFPLEYTFHVVGKTAGDADAQERFVQQVKDVISTTTIDSSSNEKEGALYQITPRGIKFTKVTIQVQVESAKMVAAIYDKLEQLELSVMQF